MAESLLEKANRLGVTPVVSKTEETLLDKAQRLGIKPVPKEQGYFSRVASSFKEAGQNIVGEVQRASTPSESVFGDVKQLGRTVLRGVGQIAGASFSPIIEAPIIKPLVEGVGRKVVSIPKVQSIIGKATQLATQYPDQAKDLEAVINIATLGAGKAAYAPVKGEVKALAKDVGQAAKIALSPSEEAIQSNIVELFQKSIKPTAKKTVAQGERYENQTLEALKTIKSNADSLNIQDTAGEIITGRTPQTISELSQALEQTKKTVFNQYDSLAKQAGTQGATIDAKPIAEEVLRVSQNKALQLTNPEVVKYAEGWAERLRNLDVLDTETTQAVIQNLNQNLQAFYRNPTYDSASKVAVDAVIANNFRMSLDRAIETATGKEYQVLKNQYSALKAIENDVTRAASRDARKNIKGLLDYTDIFTSGQMLSGVLSLNPAMFTKGAIERGFKEYLKFLNDPNRAIDNIFQKLNLETSKKFVPESATLKTVKNIRETPNKQGGFIQGYKETGNLTTKLLTKLEGRDTVSKQFISDLTNSADMKQVEKDIVRQVLQGEKDIVNVSDFAKKVKNELLPLKTKSSDIYKSGKDNFGENMLEEGNFTPKYEQISLPKELKGKVETYKENIYESPVATSAGETHFAYQSKNYFGHTRIEDMADNQTRRVIEVQSDLYQKGNLEREGRAYDATLPTKENNKIMAEKAKGIAKLQQYNDPTAHFRMIREEIKKASQDGKTKLQFPTGETAMKIEGLGQGDNHWAYTDRSGKYVEDFYLNDAILEGDKNVIGKEARRVVARDNWSSTDGEDWIITDVLGDGKFKAAPAEIKNYRVGKEIDDVSFANQKLIDEQIARLTETFDISGKVDTNNPIYRFYEKDMGRYLKNNFDAQTVTDKQGVKWYEVPVKKEWADKPVTAFGKIAASPLFIGAGATALGAGALKVYEARQQK